MQIFLKIYDCAAYRFMYVYVYIYNIRLNKDHDVLTMWVHKALSNLFWQFWTWISEGRAVLINRRCWDVDCASTIHHPRAAPAWKVRITSDILCVLIWLLFQPLEIITCSWDMWGDTQCCSLVVNMVPHSNDWSYFCNI